MTEQQLPYLLSAILELVTGLIANFIFAVFLQDFINPIREKIRAIKDKIYDYLARRSETIRRDREKKQRKLDEEIRKLKEDKASFHYLQIEANLQQNRALILFIGSLLLFIQVYLIVPTNLTTGRSLIFSSNFKIRPIYGGLQGFG